MAFQLDIFAPFSFSVGISSRHLSVFWGGGDAGFYLSAADSPSTDGKRVKTWRNPLCNSLNIEAFRLHLVWNSGRGGAAEGVA